MLRGALGKTGENALDSADLSGAAVAESRDRNSWIAGWKTAASVALITRIVFLAIAGIAAWLLADTVGPPRDAGIGIWARWDGEHLLRISDFGYTDPRTFPHATVFFPLLPLLVKALSGIGLATITAALLISAVGSTVAFAYLYKLASEEYGAEGGGRAVLYLAFFPTAVFLVAPYTESLFLAGAIPAFYYARRKEWSKVAIPCAVAVAARNSGLFLLVGLAVEFLSQRDLSARAVRRAGASLLVGMLPFLIYAGYLWRTKGHPLYFLTDYRLGWNRTFSSPLSSLQTTLDMTAVPEYPTNWMMAARGELVAAVIALGLIGWTIARREWGFAAFMGSQMAVLVTGNFFWSIPRALLQFFPILLFLVELTRNRTWLHETVLVASGCVATIGVIVYTSGNWFY